MYNMQTIQTDVVIIGAGYAGIAPPEHCRMPENHLLLLKRATGLVAE